jgi:hypothetical protein
MQQGPHRIRSLAWFFVAALYFALAKEIAYMAANGLSSGVWFEFVDRAILLFLLIVGFSALGYVGQRQQQPLKEMGLIFRCGWRGEFAVGSAIGWAGTTACALLIALFGGMVVTFYTGMQQFALLPLDLAVLLTASLVEEVAFRGYPFQRLIEATNPFLATLIISILYAAARTGNPGSNAASFLFTMLAGWLLSIAYLHTRALWVGWGIHFAWNASLAVLFGLPLSGLTQFSPVISTTALGPAWLSGFDYGPEGSAVGIVLILALIPVLIKATHDLKHRYAQPVIVPGGIPVDLDAVSRRQHEEAMGPPQAAAPQIVQIAGIQPQAKEQQVSEPTSQPENSPE